MPRPKTKPPLSAVKRQQQNLRKIRKAWKGHDPNVPGLCDLLIAQLDNLPKLLAAGEGTRALKMKRDMERAMKLLGAAIKRNAQ